MDFTLFSDVVLVRDLPDEKLRAGDLGTIVELHHAPGKETGYSVEFFDMLGKTIAVAILPSSMLRLPAHSDVPAVRPTAESVAE